ncbi:putative ABC transport system permease protein [Bacillus sp. 491mf]|uniref:ABC transporter permease n=1 Tax=Bacillus sp. 491mf TaxID=1761755 RepID=UPI0008E11913|nr:ABC transporter permease [Bacillus sp. 491mf]SFC81744.1 putative ABC transport system permease protein [Bacillus sp. 491mf]
MNIVELIRMILTNLIQNKYKVILTSLGIVIGTMTIISVIAIGQGGEKKIEDQFKNLSAETIYINYQPPLNNDKQQKKERLGMKEIDVIKDENPLLKKIYLREILYSEVKVNGKKKSTSIVGVSEGYSEVSNYKIEKGNDFSLTDFTEGTRCIVLGNNLATQYFGSSEQALDKEITIKGYSYKVIGVLKKISDGLQGVNPDDTIFLPYETLSLNDLIGDQSIPQGVALATGKDKIKPAMKRIKSSLNYVFDDSNMYEVEDAGSRIDAAMSSAKTMNVLLISMAVIVFIVSGIGIMNVLFVSVNERTKEIGILKAIGTSQQDILKLFLYESIGIGVMGGSFGVIFSYILLPFLKNSSIPVHDSFQGKIIAIGFAILTATVFGFYPAYKASKLTPVKALNKN